MIHIHVIIMLSIAKSLGIADVCVLMDTVKTASSLLLSYT